MPRERIGIVGVPPLSIIREIEERNGVIIDLDEPQIKKSIEAASLHLPRVYCAILRTVVLNALHIELDLIYIDTGPGKCDCALHVATILKNILDIPVIQTRNTDSSSYGFPLCRCEMDLPEKMARITGSVQSCAAYDSSLKPCIPTAGFWGVPPRDFSFPRHHPCLWLEQMYGK
ncbi:MAG: hypothetical protein OEM02_04675 [Desulfobulbaceae bacterium]|nr:hypothetical protein [Desulfobulbaceae bacterium]